ncbi:hypothetical protein [Sulfidibacter corallicola]|uniref:Uncharacterized protein n=1 Tax=Sulfidibacter corallicola TaxID=2818388 RepID=A0A8A4THF8_SULCO|nr:hypothetical protein [Sulfidibacter corallicola]QTD48937.1 hypothetical protein J3U87_25415 [Sulfidibacter corallicola]
MGFFYEHARAVEQAVFHKTADLFNLKVDLIFYDTTAVSFRVDEEDVDFDERTSPGFLDRPEKQS